MATLRLQSSAWDWAGDAPEQAPWWVIDSSCDVDLHGLASRYDQLQRKPQVAFLAVQMAQLPRAAWAFFKPPVISGLVFNWIRASRLDERPAAHPPAALAMAAAPWRQGLLRLKKWPNVARYGDQLHLTVACSRLLVAPATYAEMLEWKVPIPLLDRMLQDTLEHGQLEIAAAPVEPAAAAPKESGAAPLTHPADAARWDLVKRLIKKFTFK
jgi:hypothetical protein